MKLTVIGGGGVRSIFLARSLAPRAEELGITELCFMDNDSDKLRVYGGMARHISGILAPKLHFTLTDNAEDALTNAAYVITTIRVGGDDMRVEDELIALSHGVLGQETTGAAGLSFAMRSVPVLAEYCRIIQRVALPTVKMFNFTNPAGVVSQALRDMGFDFTYGICDAPSGMLHQFAAYLGKEPSSVYGECYGLNHLSYFATLEVDGKDVLESVIEDDNAYQNTDLRYFEKALVRNLHAIPNEYLYYFYYREKAVENILHAPHTRGQLIARVNRGMLEELKGVDPVADFKQALEIYEKWHSQRENSYMANETGVSRNQPWRFDIMHRDIGGYAGVAIRFMELSKKAEGGKMILCTPNTGRALPFLEETDVIEATCTVSKEGCAPHRFENVPQNNMELIRRVKCYERLAAKCITQKDYQAGVDCLMLHPLVNSYSLACKLMAQYARHNADYIQF